MEVEEEMVMMMISSRSSRSCPEKMPYSDSSSSPSHDQPITSTSNWKLYRNPFYNKQPHHHRGSSTARFPHHRSLSSARKIAASFWDLAFFRPMSMERPGKENKEAAAAQIDELRAELERERRASRKLEHINKKLARELAEERRGREALERACEELAVEILSGKASVDRMKREIEEERRMMRMAEMLREERVQMKLAEAKVFLEEKMSQLEETNNATTKEEEEEPKGLILTNVSTALPVEGFPGKPMKRVALVERQPSSSEDSALRSNGDRSRTVAAAQRRLSPSQEPENPHIKRGIKGFVEFPRVVRAIRSKGRSWGSKKIECQKAQIRILLKHRGPIRSINSSLIWGS